MTTEEIEKILEEKSDEELIGIHNKYCKDTNNFDSYIYPNNEENLLLLLPSDPSDAFDEGRASADRYFSTDPWIQLNGNGHIESACDLLNNFLFPYDIAKWLARKPEDTQVDILELEEDE